MTDTGCPAPSPKAVSPDHHMPVFRLDPFKLGEILIQLGATSHNLGHSTPFSTVRSYWNREHLASLEQQFVYDLLTQRREDIVARWYGNELDASLMALYCNLMATGRWEDIEHEERSLGLPPWRTVAGGNQGVQG